MRRWTESFSETRLMVREFSELLDTVTASFADDEQIDPNRSRRNHAQKVGRPQGLRGAIRGGMRKGTVSFEEKGVSVIRADSGVSPLFPFPPGFAGSSNRERQTSLGLVCPFLEFTGGDFIGHSPGNLCFGQQFIHALLAGF